MERRNPNEPLFWMDSKGHYHVCTKRKDEMRSTDGIFDVKLIAAVCAALTAVASPFVTMAVAQEKLRIQDEAIKSQALRINENTTLVQKHDALIPTIQSDIRELKDGQKENQKIMYEILRVVKS